MSVVDVILYLGAFDKAPTGAKMTTSEIGLFVLMAIACILWSIVSYSIGFKEGHKEGYQRGRSVSRHISQKAAIK
jgi:ammonia channel protein AmtB